MNSKSPQNPQPSGSNYDNVKSGSTAVAGQQYPHYNPEPYYPPPASDNYEVKISGEAARGSPERKK
ncbi:MAG: hypothetical protein QME32_08505 [Endomicrobiia bacterium]|nr:hypothetical protein [Endomicrobiia bacterium]